VKSKKARRKTRAKSVASSGNVFADIGFKEADELALKSDLVWYINRVIEERGLKQVEAADILGINQPKVSALKRGQLEEFSVDRLMKFLVALGQSVDISIHPAMQPAVRVLKTGGGV
jgi:predicted XRE-type DNA-binding protein